MSIVIVGGNECMESQYKQICKSYGCRENTDGKSGIALPSRSGEHNSQTIWGTALEKRRAGIPARRLQF